MVEYKKLLADHRLGKEIQAQDIEIKVTPNC